MRNLSRTALSLTGAAILGFGALAATPSTAEAHGYWQRPHYRPYVVPRPVYAPRYYAPRPYYYAPPRVAYLAPPPPPPVYYAPRAYTGYYAGW